MIPYFCQKQCYSFILDALHFKLRLIGCVIDILADEGYEVPGMLFGVVGGIGLVFDGFLRARGLNVHASYLYYIPINQNWHY